MTYEMLKKAVLFAWTETTSRPKVWAKLTLFVVVISVLRHVYSELSSLAFASMREFSGLSGVFLGFLFVMAFPIFYFIYYWYVALFNILTRNALDAAQQKPLRMFSNVVHNHSLVWTPILVALVCSAIMIPSVLLLMVTRGLQGMWYNIAIGLIFISAGFAMRQMLHYFFTMFVVLDKEVTPDQALKDSYKLTTGSIFGLVLGLLCMLLLGALLGLMMHGIYILCGMAVVSVVAVFLYSFLLLQSILVLASLYQQLLQIKK